MRVYVIFKYDPEKAGFGTRLKYNAAKLINILDDYKTAFGTDPPAQAKLAVMGNTDNTDGSATGYIDYIILESSNQN